MDRLKAATINFYFVLNPAAPYGQSGITTISLCGKTLNLASAGICFGSKNAYSACEYRQ